MHLPGSQLHGFSVESDFFLNMRDLLNSESKRRRFVYGYWSDVDSLMHRYGTFNDRTTEQFYDFSNAFSVCLWRVCLPRLKRRPWF